MRGRRALRGRRGVAAVIGTLLSLLVFLSLFGLFLTQFLPLWMTDDEFQLSNTVVAQVGQIKWCEDYLALTAQPNRVCTVPITMQSQNVPIFSQPTQAVLSFHRIPQIFTNVSFNDSTIGGANKPYGNFFQNLTPGELDVQLPDRYYSPETYALTMGSLIATQGGNRQTMVFNPPWEANSVGVATNLSLTEYAMYGNVSTLTSTGTSEVYVAYVASTTYTATNTAVVVNMSTEYPCSWISFLDSSLKGTGIIPTFHPATCPVTVPNGQIYQLHIYFPAITSFTFTIVDYSVEMGLGNPT